MYFKVTAQAPSYPLPEKKRVVARTCDPLNPTVMMFTVAYQKELIRAVSEGRVYWPTPNAQSWLPGFRKEIDRYMPVIKRPRPVRTCVVDRIWYWLMLVQLQQTVVHDLGPGPYLKAAYSR